MAINWGLAQQSQGNDYLGPLQALALGQQAKAQQVQQQQQQRALQARQTAGQQLARGDTAGARQTAYASGDMELAQTIGGLEDHHRKTLGEVYDTIGSAAVALKRLPQEQRAGAFAAIAPALKARGVPDDVLASVNLSDGALDGYVATAQGVKDAIGKAEPYTLSPGQVRMGADGEILARSPYKPEILKTDEGTFLYNPNGQASGAGQGVAGPVDKDASTLR